ncbi:FAD-dependent oxidoreductase [Parasphingorhabdus sp.]|uniref:FAD-dependent oxidoreductase n=1 Tax=Parasphingorhabdus sp. TaxID=2709688 RepID=UPI002F95F63C
MERVQVLIVGAGPVGAFAAYSLSLAGIDVRLVEAASHCHEDMRASTIHPPTLDMLAEVGLLDALEAQGLRAPIYQYRNRRTNEVLSFDLTELGDISNYPYRLQCEQFKLARLATSRIADLVKFDEKLVYCEDDGNAVNVICERRLDVTRYRADYVVAADGANSLIRKLLGVQFEGFTYPEKFLTLSTTYPIEKHFENLEKVAYVADRDEWCVLLRVPDFWRVLVPASPDLLDKYLLSDANKNKVFAGLLGVDGEAIKTSHRTIYRVHQRVAQKYNHGRIILAGDAAHLNNPLGGFGMNSGIHDAWNLVDKLKRILNDGQEAEPLLALYNRQRRQIMNEVIQAQTITNHDDMVDADRQQEKLAKVLADPEKRRNYLLQQSMYQSRAREAEIA